MDTECNGVVRDVLDDLRSWWDSGRTVVVATVVTTFGSAPRPPGASMVVGPDDSVVGSISGGCVEGAVFELTRQVMGRGTPVLASYGVSDGDAFAAGLTCGGTIEVYVECVSRDTFPELGALADDVVAGRPVALATVVDHPDRSQRGRRLLIRPDAELRGGSLGAECLDTAVRDDALGLLACGGSAVLTYDAPAEHPDSEIRVFVSVFETRPRMVVFGANDFAAAVVRVGSLLGYDTTVCDARPVFTTQARFPDADTVVVDWPHRYLLAEARAGRIDGRTALVVLTHDPKFDEPLLRVALTLPNVGYVGAMGSRRTHLDRVDRLRAAGLADSAIATLSSPIGLDLGARTPEETAVSIAAEIIAWTRGGTSRRLSELRGPVHSRVG